MKYRLVIKLALIAAGPVIGLAIAFGLRGSVERTRIRSLALQAYDGNASATASLQAAGRNAVPELATLAGYRVSNWRGRLSRKAMDLPAPLGKMAGRRFAAQSDGIKLREAVAHALGSLQDNAGDAVPVLAYQLGDQEGNVRWEAAKSLAKFGKDSVPALIQTLNAQANPVKGMAVYALGLIGPNASDAIPTLVPYLSHTNVQIRGSTEYTLSQLGPESVVAMVKLAAHGEPQARVGAGRVLQRLNSSLEPPVMTLRKMANDESSAKRTRAVEALGDLRPATSLSIKALTVALDDKSLEVRLAAIKSLGNIGAKAAMALPQLKRLSDHPDEAIRETVKSAIETIEISSKTNPAVLPAKAD